MLVSTTRPRGRGVRRSLAAELAEFGVHVTLVEHRGFTTDWSGTSGGRAQEMDVYDGVRERRLQALGPVRSQPGDPQATGAAILELVDAAEPPLRVFFSSTALQLISREYASRIENWQQWDGLAQRAQGGPES
jgi:NAD(P)-dependent dehydrogenase (short-subunit alcohol dehydrogenase family)